MTTFHLDTFLSGHVYGFIFIFARVGSMMMLFPGIGESYVPSRMRLMLAFMVSFILMEPLLPRLPAPPDNIAVMTKLLTYEVIIGLFFGTLLRLLMDCLETVGFVIALQSGLSNATVFNPSLGTQSPLPSSLLSVVGTIMIFITGLDHLLFQSIAALYDIFPPGGELMPGDMAQTIIQTVNRSFVTGIELAMPFLVMGLLMYLALGMMQKLMPQIQLFLVALPVQVWGGLTLMGLTIAGIITIWLRYFDSSVGSFFSR